MKKIDKLDITHYSKSRGYIQCKGTINAYTKHIKKYKLFIFIIKLIKSPILRNALR